MKTFIVIVAVAVTSSNPGTIQVFKEQFPAFWKPDTSGPTPRYRHPEIEADASGSPWRTTHGAAHYWDGERD